MPFDLSTATPVDEDKKKFDLSTAKPVESGFDMSTAEPVEDMEQPIRGVQPTVAAQPAPAKPAPPATPVAGAPQGGVAPSPVAMGTPAKPTAMPVQSERLASYRQLNPRTVTPFGQLTEDQRASMTPEQIGASAQASLRGHPIASGFASGVLGVESGIESLAGKLGRALGMEWSEKAGDNLSTHSKYMAAASEALLKNVENPIVQGLTAAPAMGAQYALGGNVGFGLDSASRTWDKARADGRTPMAAATLATLSGVFNAAIGPLIEKMPWLGPWMASKGSGMFESALKKVTHSEMMMELMHLGNGMIDVASVNGGRIDAEKVADFVKNFASIAEQKKIIGEGLGFAAGNAIMERAMKPNATLDDHRQALRQTGLPPEIERSVLDHPDPAVRRDAIELKQIGVPDEVVAEYAAATTPEAREEIMQRYASEATPMEAAEGKPQPAPAMEQPVAASSKSLPARSTIDEMSGDGRFFRVVRGDDAMADIIESGVVRTKTKKGTSLKEQIENRPTAFPSFSKGEPSREYAKGDDNHYIVVTESETMRPSSLGRHGKGTTHFPTDDAGRPMREMSGSDVSVYKHIGDGNYELVYDRGEPVAAPAKPEPVPAVHVNQPVVDEIARGLSPESRLVAVDRPAGERAAEADVFEKGARLLGLEPVYLKNETGPKFNGTVDVDNGRVFVDVDTPSAYHGVLTHEAVHRVAEVPELWEPLAAVLKEEGVGFDKFKQQLESQYKARGVEFPTDEKRLLEEFAGDAMQKRGTDPAFWQRLYEKAPEAVRKIIDELGKIVAKITNREVPREVQDYFRDIEKVHAAAEDAIAKFLEMRQVEMEQAGFEPETIERYKAATPAEREAILEEQYAKENGENAPPLPEEANAIQVRSAEGMDARQPPETREAVGGSYAEEQAVAKARPEREVGAKFKPQAEAMRRGAVRMSDAVDENLARWRESVRASGIDPSGGVEDMRLPAGVAKKGGKSYDDALKEAYDLGLITEDQLSEPSAIGDLLRGENLSPKQVEAKQRTFEMQQAEAESTEMARKGYEPTEQEIADFPELAKFKGYGKSQDKAADIDGVKVYFDGTKWKGKAGGKWRVIKDEAMLADIRQQLPGVEADYGPSQGLPFSIESKARDDEYMVAVKRGDTKETQRIVDEAARAAGYAVGPVWHGTRQQFTSFNETAFGIHFGTKQQAERAMSTGVYSDIKNTGTSQRTMATYLKLNNPWRFNGDVNNWNYMPDLRRAMSESIESGSFPLSYEQLERGIQKYGSLRRDAPFRKMLEKPEQLKKILQDNGVDGVVYKNAYEGTGDSYIVFDPSQIKSADAITRDDAGNIVPLSRRFNPQSTDIRFSIEGEKRGFGEKFREQFGEDTPETRQRRVITNILAIPEVDASLKAALKAAPESQYEQKANPKTIENANAFINKHGADKALQLLDAKDSGLPFEEQAVAKWKIVQSVQDAVRSGKIPEAQRKDALDFTQRRLTELAEEATSLGRGAQVYRVIKEAMTYSWDMVQGIDSTVTDLIKRGKGVADVDEDIVLADQAGGRMGDNLSRVLLEKKNLEKLVDKYSREVSEQKKWNLALTRIREGERMTPEQSANILTKFLGGKKAKPSLSLSIEAPDMPTEVRMALVQQAEYFFRNKPDAKKADFLEYAKETFGEAIEGYDQIKDAIDYGYEMAKQEPVVPKKREPTAAEKKQSEITRLEKKRDELKLRLEQGDITREPRKPSIQSPEITKLREEIAALNKRIAAERRSAEREQKIATMPVSDAIRRAAREVGKSLRELVQDHFAGRDPGRTLLAKLEEYGLKRGDAIALAKEFQVEWNKIIDEQGEKMLKQQLASGQRPVRAKDTPMEVMLRQIRMGALTRESVRDAFYAKHGIPTLTDADRAKMQRLADAVAEAKKNGADPMMNKRLFDANREVAKFVSAKTKGSWRDLLGAWPIFSLLSGLGTHKANFLYTAANKIAESATDQLVTYTKGLSAALRGNPKQAMDRMHQLKMLVEASTMGHLIGSAEAQFVLKEGETFGGEQAGKFDDPKSIRVFEFDPNDFSGLKRSYLKMAQALRVKYNARAMSAEDLLWRVSAREEAVVMLAAEEAVSQGLTGQAFRQHVADALGYDRYNEFYEAAKTQLLEGHESFEKKAMAEGLSPGKALLRARALEIDAKAMAAFKLNQTRRDSIRIESERRAAEVTFQTEHPPGLAGGISDAISRVSRMSPALAPFGLFSKTMANVINAHLQYDPLTFVVKSMRDKTRGFEYTFSASNPSKPTVRPLSPLEQQRRWTRMVAMNGVMLSMAGTAYAMLKAWKDDPEKDKKEPFLYFTSMGPQDPEQYKAWKADGGKPFSIVVDGKHYPMGGTPALAPLAILGSWMDTERYESDPAKKAEAWERFTTAYWILAKGELSQNFLTSINSLNKAINQSSREAMERQILSYMGQFSGYVVPSGIKELANIIDPKRYEVVDMKDALFQNTPVVKQMMMKPALNLFGEPIIDRPAERFMSEYKPSPEMRWLIAHNFVPQMPKKSDLYPNMDDSDKMTPLSPTEYYNLISTMGPRFKERINTLMIVSPENIPYLDKDDKDSQRERDRVHDRVQKAYQDAKERAVREILRERRRKHQDSTSE